MPDIPRSVLYGKLNSIGFKALEGAATFCKLRGNPHVEFVHFLAQLLQTQDTDVHRIVQAFQLDAARLAADIQSALDRLPRGASAISDFSVNLDAAMERAWALASLKYGENSIRSGHIILALLRWPELQHVIKGISREFDKVKSERLADEFLKVTDGSPEAVLAASMDRGGSGVPGEGSGAMAPAAMGKEEAIRRFTSDLTEQARSGKLDPIVGRDDEVRQCIDILMRRRQNNPMLTGEAGVGKTAVVEGFAQKIVSGDVPPHLRDVRLIALDLTRLQAGASMKGEFENRLQQLVDEVQGSAKPVILFIDEAHTLIGAGGGAGAGDAANILKPALARGTLRTIGATTQAEFKQYFEKDPAMTRRFQVVKVDEPDEAKCLAMIRGLSAVMERHHKVRVLDEALEAAVKLSKRYIQGRQLPDKAVSLIDTASARVAVALHSIPAEIDDTRKRLDLLATELEIIDREIAAGGDHAERRARVVESVDREKARLAELEAHFEKEKGFVNRILELEGRLTAKPEAGKELSEADRAAIVADIKSVRADLVTLQGERPLISPCVDASAVSAVVSDWTGIPLGRMVSDELKGVLGLADTLEKRVVGQRHALEALGEQIGLSKAKLANPTRPVGVFMLVGPSGVGKTETAEALAEALFGGLQGLIRINMSEYQEAHKVSLLMGSPPGYVGYGKGGVMTEAVRRRPYSVLLLDEVEKAHPDIHEIFFQVFDKGQMKDSEGVDIDFRNTVIILTSNVGTDMVMKACRDVASKPDPKELADRMRAPLMEVFPPALLGRLNIVPFYPLSPDMMRGIIKIQLDRVGKRVAEGYNVPFEVAPEVEDLIVSRVTEIDSGARAIDAIITRQMLPNISRELLGRLMRREPLTKVRIGAQGSEFAYAFE
jgi:type VI secretion system protein VasG